MKIKETFEEISKQFEISKEVLYQAFVNDDYFRIFIKSAIYANTDNKLICKEIAEKHYLFAIDFYRNKIKA
jgi:hypothetical protein